MCFLRVEGRPKFNFEFIHLANLFQFLGARNSSAAMHKSIVGPALSGYAANDFGNVRDLLAELNSSFKISNSSVRNQWTFLEVLLQFALLSTSLTTFNDHLVSNTLHIIVINYIYKSTVLYFSKVKYLVSYAILY